MKKSMIQKLLKILSISVSVIFYLSLVGYVLGLFWQFLDISSFSDNPALFEIMEFKFKMSVVLFVLSLCSIFLNKKLVMLVWISVFIFVGHFYDGFSTYRNYLEFDNCLDMGNVWDYQEHRCRQDCLKWTAEQGCVPLSKE